MDFQSVDQDGDEDDGTVDDFLHVRLNAGEIHAVVDHRDDESADERAHDSALSPGEARTPDDDGRDHF